MNILPQIQFTLMSKKSCTSETLNLSTCVDSITNSKNKSYVRCHMSFFTCHMSPIHSILPCHNNGCSLQRFDDRQRKQKLKMPTTPHILFLVQIQPTYERTSSTRSLLPSPKKTVSPRRQTSNKQTHIATKKKNQDRGQLCENIFP